MAVEAAATDLRRTGLSELGGLPWGAHCCAFFSGKEQLLEILVPFFREGLRAGEFCLWVTSHPLDPDEARRALAEVVPDLDEYLRRGQIEILEPTVYHGINGERDGADTARGWLEKEKEALRRGFEGLRLSGNVFRMEGREWNVFSAYESVVDEKLNSRRILALCTYAEENCGAFEAIDVAARHQHVIVRQGDRWRRLELQSQRRTQAALVEVREELKASSSELMRAEQVTATLAAIVESSDDAIKAQDMDGIIQSWNRGAERMYGYSAAEAVGQPVSILVPPGARDENPGMLERIRRGESVHRHETVRRSKDGRVFYVSLTMSPIRDTAGRIVGASTITRDITERMQAEEELARLNEELEQRVASRTAELATSNKELEAFAYSASHDLRAPLRAIQGFGQALLEDYAGKLEPEAMIYLQRIRAASQRMEVLIDGMLKLSRMTRGEMRRTRVNMSALAQAIALELRKSAPEREVDFSIAPGLVVNADANLLRILLENLLENAWKFTSRHPRARITVGARRERGETVYFVRDDGAGFDMEYAEALFGAFRRLHGANEFEGTGIGLATVKRIVNRHGGRVWAEGEVEKGATVFFTLEEQKPAR